MVRSGTVFVCVCVRTHMYTQEQDGELQGNLRHSRDVIVPQPGGY